MKKSPTKLSCAQCAKKFIKAEVEKELWPFCSKRCKMIDLAKWLSEKYVIDQDTKDQG